MTTTTSKIVIKDSLTNEYYCVPMTAKDYYGNPTTGDNDFPYWSDDVTEACEFSSELLANHEMSMNDLTCDGTRNPVIVKA